MSRNHVHGGLLVVGPTDIVVGIDPSLTGFALTAMAVDTGVFDSRVYRPPNRGIVRLMNVEVWLLETLSEFERAGHVITDAAIEDTVSHSHAATAMGELAATVKRSFFTTFDNAAQFPLRVPPTVVKKFATNRGNAKKSEVMLAVYKSWGVEFSDDNMADSFVIAQIASQRTDTAFRTTVLETMSDSKFRDSAL